MTAELPDREELLGRLDEASKTGSVTATKLLLEELRRDHDDEASDQGGFAELDELEPRRQKRQSA